MPRINGVFLKAVATDCQGGINITPSGSTSLGSMTISIAGNPLTRYIWPQGNLTALAAPGNASALFQYVPLQNALTGSQRLRDITCRTQAAG
jgi:hypothetical protein